jgi:hypothetical protein
MEADRRAGCMEEPEDKRSFIWIIDDLDRIVHVNEAWLAFARENGAPELSRARVLAQYLWRFIQGRETAYLYKQILGRVRAGNSPLKFPFRCDSPDCRRFMEMKLSLLDGGAVQFMAQPRREYRPPLDLLTASGDRSELFVKFCSWCKKIYIPERGWEAVEDAIGLLDLFGNHPMPRLTHTICDDCSDFVRQELSQEPVSSKQ